MDDNIAFRMGVLRGMIAAAAEKGLIPNGVVMGTDVLARINAEVSQLTGLLFDPENPEDQTVYGLPIIPYSKDPDTLRLTFEDYSVI